MFPIVLAHGIARFDILRQKLADELNLTPNPLDDRLQYFKNIRTHLNANGFPSVFNSNVNFAGPVRLRAEQLKIKTEEALAQTEAQKVHIIAHSMGGLDARHMIVDLEMADKVASLTTIGTPHHGSLLANHIIEKGGIFLMIILKEILNLDFDGAKDLTVEACRQFNDRARDAEAKNSVFYQTYSSFEPNGRMFIPLVAGWRYLRKHDDINDGLVTVNSQKWESELTASDGMRKQIVQHEFPVPADHLNEVGWWDFSEVFGSLENGNFVTPEEYEAQIKNIYLEIARNLQNLPNQ